MLILVVGAVGGVGTTTLVAELVKRGGPSVALDLADGTLAARLERGTYPLDSVVYQRQTQTAIVDDLALRRPVLLWTPACRLNPARVGQLLAAVGQRWPLVADGGLTPPVDLGGLLTTVLIVTRAGHPIADWHVARLRRAYPGAPVVSGDLKAAAAALAAQWLPRPEPTGVRALMRGGPHVNGRR